jgi:hypothetical protein
MIAPHHALPKHQSRHSDDRNAADDDLLIQKGHEIPPERGDAEHSGDANPDGLEPRDEWVKHFMDRLSDLLGPVKGKH